jgi:predicted transcriptional regulator
MKNSIMTEKIARRGINTPHSYEPDILEKISVQQVVKESGIVFSEENTIQEVRDWLSKEPGYSPDHFIVSNNEGEFTGIVASTNLMSHDNLPGKKIGTLIKQKNTFIDIGNNLRTVVEAMARENTDLVMVTSKESNHNIVGLLSYRDILSAYKYVAEEHAKGVPNISIKRRSFKMIIRGQHLFTTLKRKKND